MFPTDLQQVMAIVMAALAGFLYFRILVWAGRSNRRFFRVLLFFVCLIFLCNTVADYKVITSIAVGPTTTFGALALAILHSLELFLFQTHFFDNGYQEYFFETGNYGAGGDIVMLYLFVVLFVLACISSMALIIRAFSRRRSGRAWLHDNRDNTANTHVFFLGGEAAMLVAKSIGADSSKKGEHSIFVGYPDPYQNYVDLSIWEKIMRVFSTRTEDDKGPFDAVVYSKVPLNETSGDDICGQMGLPDLKPFLLDGSCSVYLLTDNENDNLHCADLLAGMGCEATIYCRACHEGLNRMYEDMISAKDHSTIQLVDSSFLALRSLKTPRNRDLLPLNFVEHGTEGWVSGPFNAMILGFGELGHEALGYIYEYSAFVGKDFKKSPFSCAVVDSKMDSMKEAYLKDYPGMSEDAGVSFISAEVGSDAFWSMMNERIASLNYIVICLGDSRLNLTTAIETVKLAFEVTGRRPDRLAVLVAMDAPTKLDRDTISHFNGMEAYRDLIHPFGSQEEVWTFDNITNRSFDSRAKRYAKGYNIASGDTPEVAEKKWDKREEEIHGDDIRKVRDGLRKKSQDYANCFHMETKMALVGDDIRSRRKEIAALIPSNYEAEPVHYNGDDKHVETVLHYLAVLEHIRWEASHVAIGYRPGKPGEETDPIRRVHACITDYENLSEMVKHYDYLVVKTTFELYDDAK